MRMTKRKDDHWKGNTTLSLSICSATSLPYAASPHLKLYLLRTKLCPVFSVELFLIHETHKQPSFLCTHKHSQWAQSTVPSTIFDTLQTLHSAFQFVRRGTLTPSPLSCGCSGWGCRATHPYTAISALFSVHMPHRFFIAMLQIFPISALQGGKPKATRDE